MNWLTNARLWGRAHGPHLWPAAALITGFVLMLTSPAKPVYSMLTGFVLVVLAGLGVVAWRWLRPRVGGWTAMFALSIVAGILFAVLLAAPPACPLNSAGGRCDVTTVAAGGLSTTLLVWVVVAMAGPMLLLSRAVRFVAARVRRRRNASQPKEPRQ